MIKRSVFLIAFVTTSVFAQESPYDGIVNKIIKEATENSQLEELAFELIDMIGPRLVGTPQMQQAHDWAIKKYKSWNIEVRNEQWGEWYGWERGTSHVEMVYPRLKLLEGKQLSWSKPTPSEGITAEVIAFPEITDSISFHKWLPQVKGKFVMTDTYQPTGRPNSNWEKYARPESWEKMKALKRESQEKDWYYSLGKIGYSYWDFYEALKDAGAAAILTSNWAGDFGSNKISASPVAGIPSVSLSLEDYGMLYRMLSHGVVPKIKIKATSKELGMAPTYNTIAEIKGSEKPEEYVILSAHFDSWDSANGATDNGTGTLMMMEALRILKKVLPNPKRTILVGHWGSEEQGKNGSRAFVEDHPEMIDNIQAVFNQDNGTGRIDYISGGGFLHSYRFLRPWMRQVPRHIADEVELRVPGTPGSGGSDHEPFLAVGVPTFFMNSLSWDYFSNTHHTNRDTYDKIVFDDVQSNAILVAILAYMASESDEKIPREKSVLPIDSRTGKPREWPKFYKPIRKATRPDYWRDRD